MTKFWIWLLRKGPNGKRGFCNYFDKWLFLHIFVGLFLAYVIPVTIADAARVFLLPIAGILIGLSFAWSGNALALLQTDEIEEMTEYHSGGFEYYVYTYQMAILAILATLVIWGLAGLDLFDLVWPTKSSMSLYFVIKFILYFLGSVALRECWQVVLSAQLLLLARKKIKKHKINNQANSKRDE